MQIWSAESHRQTQQLPSLLGVLWDTSGVCPFSGTFALPYTRHCLEFAVCSVTACTANTLGEFEERGVSWTVKSRTGMGGMGRTVVGGIIALIGSIQRQPA